MGFHIYKIAERANLKDAVALAYGAFFRCAVNLSRNDGGEHVTACEPDGIVELYFGG